MIEPTPTGRRTNEQFRCALSDRIDQIIATLTTQERDSLAVVLSKVLGAMLPLLATKLRLDPATAATPVLTTIVDACSLTVMFAVAELLTVVWPGL